MVLGTIGAVVGGSTIAASQAGKASGATRRGVGKLADAGRLTVNRVEDTIDGVKSSVKAKLAYMFINSKAITHGSVNIGKVVNTSYKVRTMPPGSSFTIAKLSKKGNAIYMPEATFKTEAFGKAIEKAAREQDLAIDAQNFSIRIDAAGRMRISYKGKFTDAFLDQFGGETPSAVAVKNAIRSVIQAETNHICMQIMIGHKLKTMIEHNSGYINYKVKGKVIAMSLEDAAKLANGEIKDPIKLHGLNILLNEIDGSSTENLKTELNIDTYPKGRLPQDIIAGYPDGRLVMDKIAYMRKDRSLAFDSISDNNSQPTNTTQASTPATQLNNATVTTTVVPSASNTTTNMTTSLENAININNLTTPEAVTGKLAFIANFINTPLVAASMELTIKAIELKTALEAKLASMTKSTTSATTAPATTTSATTTPKATTPVATTVEATAPVATTPEATTPEATTPEATTPEATTPEATTPENEVQVGQVMDFIRSYESSDSILARFYDLFDQKVADIMNGLTDTQKTTMQGIIDKTSNDKGAKVIQISNYISAFIPDYYDKVLAGWAIEAVEPTNNDTITADTESPVNE